MHEGAYSRQGWQSDILLGPNNAFPLMLLNLPTLVWKILNRQRGGVCRIPWSMKEANVGEVPWRPRDAEAHRTGLFRAAAASTPSNNSLTKSPNSVEKEVDA